MPLNTTMPRCISPKQERCPKGAKRTPGYYGLLAAIYATVGPDTKAVAFAHALLGALTASLITLLAAQIVSRRATLIAGLLYALSPTKLAYTPLLLSENLAAPLVVLAVLCLARADVRRRAWIWLAAAGAAASMLLLARPAGLLFMPAFVLLTCYSPSQRRWRPRNALLFIVTVGLVLAPWLGRNYAEGYGVTLTDVGGQNLWRGNNPRATNGGWLSGTPRPTDADGQRINPRVAAVNWIRQNPRRYAALCRTRLLRLIGTTPDGMM